MTRRRTEADWTDDVVGSLPKNFLRPCLLLLIREAPSHGYDLLERLAELGFRRIDPGTLYRNLRSLEHDGSVRSTWSVSEFGPPRRTYRLTHEGLDWLHVWAASLRETRRAVDAFLDRYRSVAGAPLVPDAASVDDGRDVASRA